MSLAPFVVCTEIRSGVKNLQLAQDIREDRNILRWLSSPDPSTNHNAARAKHEPTTGDWFLRSQDFSSWRSGLGQCMFLHGIPGCGKSILCSTIIEDLKHRRDQCSGSDLIYFYFDFNQEKKQTVDGFLRSMIV